MSIQWAGSANAEPIEATLVVRADQPGGKINPNIYGQFAEHLGRCIYEGIWVGEDSTIPVSVTMTTRRSSRSGRGFATRAAVTDSYDWTGSSGTRIWDI